MLNDLVTAWCRRLGNTPCFRIHGKGRAERDWRVIDVYATGRRDSVSRLPLWSGTCTTWSNQVIAVGWEFAELALREQTTAPASRHYPVEVAGGRLRDGYRRRGAGGPCFPSASEILAHEIGHTWQAVRLGPFYLPLVGSVTLFREGPHFWNHFENQASEQGLFGGIVNGSVCGELIERIGLR
jgi:hypothetical protein